MSTHRKKWMSFWGLLFALMPLLAIAQSAQIKGTVLDDKENPLGEVTVVAQLNNVDVKRVQTDTLGHFIIPDLKLGQKYDFKFSYVGYETYTEKDVTVSREVGNLLIRMKASYEKLEEVVMIGYGRQSKRKITGAISSVQSEDLNKYAAGNFAQQLAGKAAGVIVNDYSSMPGASPQIQIRGISTITAGTEPLIVVDGFPLTAGTPMNAINPQDIKTIDILKDPSSAAIYGSRASNGVVLITTKSGSSEKPKVSVSMYYGLQQRSDKVKLADAYQYALYSTEARDYAYYMKDPTNRSESDDAATRKANGASKRDLRLNYVQPYLDNEPGLTNTDWLGAIFRTAPMSDYNFTLSGKTGKRSSYYFAGDYFDQEGIVINTGMKKYSATLKLNASPTDWLNFGISLMPTYNQQRYFNNDGNTSDDPIAQALIMYPFFSPYNSDGTLAISKEIAANTAEDGALGENPVAFMKMTKYNRNYFQIFGNTFLEATILNGLKLKTVLGGNFQHIFIDYYSPSTIGTYRTAAPKPASAQENNTSSGNYLTENTITYDRSLNAHHFNLLVGYTFQKESNKSTSVTGSNIADDNLENIAGASSYSVSADRSVWTQISYLARLQYDYLSRYLFSAAIRKDGSSRFGSNTKWGSFPSLTAGWIVTNESFWKKPNWLDFLKIRASWGKAGNNQIGSYGSISTLGKDNYVFGSTLASGYATSSSPNPNLSWETKESVNIGFDMNFLHYFSVSTNYYNSITSNLLLDVPVPAQSGYTSSLQNIGKVRNRGVELEFSGQNISIGKILWGFSGNIAANANKVLFLTSGETQIITGTNSAFITKVGSPIAELYGYQVTGLYKTQDEIDNSVHMDGTQVGDYKVADLNGDGVVNTDDRKKFGTYSPKFTYGFSTNLSYMAFDLSISMNGIYGRKIYDGDLVNMEDGESWAVPSEYSFKNRYHPTDNPNGFLAQPTTNMSTNRQNTRASSMYFNNADYIRIRNVQLGYNINTNKVKKVISSCRVYLSANNLFTFTSFRGFNPDATTASTVLTSGFSSAKYPVAKTFMLGANISF